MRYASFIFLFFQITILFGQTPANDPHWQLLWQDEFDSCCLNTNRWIAANNGDHYGEPTLFLAQNVYTSGGYLVIKTDNIPTIGDPTNTGIFWTQAGSCSAKSYDYTSGWVETTESNNLKYGYIEAHISMPLGEALHGSFWTFLGDNVSNAHNANDEIDIAELIGHLSGYNGTANPCGWVSPNLTNSHPDQVFTTNIHLDYPKCPNPNYFQADSMSSYTSLHTYAIEWSPSRIIWYLDGYPVRLLPNPGIIDPIRIIFNNDVDIKYSATYPNYMYVKYVKVYTLKEDCNDYIDAMNYDFSTYNNVEKNYINIGDCGGNNSLSVGDNVLLRASQYIKINGSFYVPVGASFYADANGDCPNNINTTCTLTFDPCTYDFTNYNNSEKRNIELGGNGCNINIKPVNNELLLEATDKIVLKPGVTVIPVAGKSVDLKIVPCQ